MSILNEYINQQMFLQKLQTGNGQQFMREKYLLPQGGGLGAGGAIPQSRVTGLNDSDYT
jgi:hypothetical protein